LSNLNEFSSVFISQSYWLFPENISIFLRTLVDLPTFTLTFLFRNVSCDIHTDYFAAEKGSGDGLDVFIFKRNGEVVIDSVLAVNSELSNKHISIAYDAMQKLYLTVASFTDDTKLEAVINPQNGKVERTNAISD
jgi:hypothetical protein